MKLSSLGGKRDRWSKRFNISFSINCQQWPPYSPFLMMGSNLFSLRFDVGLKNVLFVGRILQNAEEKFETLPSANSFCRRIMMKKLFNV